MLMGFYITKATYSLSWVSLLDIITHLKILDDSLLISDSIKEVHKCSVNLMKPAKQLDSIQASRKPR